MKLTTKRYIFDSVYAAPILYEHNSFIVLPGHYQGQSVFRCGEESSASRYPNCPLSRKSSIAFIALACEPTVGGFFFFNIG